MSLTPAPPASSICTNCAAPLLDDQRYCLSCGHPASPVRLAFLDVLQGEHRPPGAGGLSTTPVAYAPLLESPSAPAWLRRYAGLFSVLSVLLMALIVGLLVGHWVTQSKAPGPQVIKIEGLSGAPLAAAASTTPSTSTTPAASAGIAPTVATAGASKAELEETAKEEKAATPPPKAAKVSTGTLQKLASTTGKKHQEELNKLGNQPIETTGNGSSTTTTSSPTESKSIGAGSKVESIE
jgi:hypothetical protein